jgi:predicted metal-dependent hydrolase
MFRKRPSRPTVVGRRVATLEGQTVAYTIKRSSRAKHVRLEMRPNTGLTVVVPQRYSLEEVPGLLEARRRWILGHLARYARQAAPAIGRPLTVGDSVPYLGRELRLVSAEGTGKRAGVRLEQGRIVVGLGSATMGLAEALERWYRSQAAGAIGGRAAALSAQMGVTYRRLSIRGQRTRWGSCSAKGNLSFNWKLMMAPQPVIDYVVIHELAHLKRMDHSKGFWELVARHCPRWREHRKWLKEHETRLAGGLCS